MADINTVVLVGRLVRDAELRVTGGGLAICKFSLAINRRRKQGDSWVDEANFFDVVLMGRQGEAIQQYLIKGKQVGIQGELRQNRWQDDAGNNRSKVEIFATNVQLLGGGGSGGGSRGGSGYDNGNSGGSAGGYSDYAGPSGGSSGFDDDVPF
ncbi:single-stranded DNA-binding protein [Spirochaeta africana]|uniref:Single-stranded DNA-binding protein n=1 Tax=Spirochaeta africana (strain ATCC 700263 / DSM 8902 / Z-7692) TaxID=889378 RepID=H9UKK5_SPIAZ|nr:single-stranded DNA-binding protein [Spirochaeta africana]AFG38048.1 single stranded DNA-binding protein [Spirochaeta africana DSM 8902]